MLLPLLVRKVGKMGKRQSKSKALEKMAAGVRRHSRLAMGTLPLVLAILTGCSTVSEVPQVTTLSAAVVPLNSSDSSTQLAAASSSDPQLTDFARDQFTDDAVSPHQPHRRTCLKAIHDAFTKPWYGNYLGPDNFGYDKQPIDELDAAAREHDMAYNHCQAAGIGGALFCVSAGRADIQLARRAFLALPSLDFGGRLMGVGTGIAMGFIGIVKLPLAELREVIHHKSEATVATPTS